jgi:branched-chain amino acid transport system substrate-binding protein
MHTLGKLAAVLLVATLVGHAAVAKEVRIGLLPDLDGPYADISGKGVVEAARMAIEDTKDRLAGWQVDVVSADSQGKPDVASAIVQHWFDEDHVDVIAGVPNSGIALALQKLVTDRHKLQFITGAASSDLTGKACSPNAADWQDDNYMQASAGVAAMTKRGARTWFFITADYAFGHNLEDLASRLVTKAGGHVLGDALHPFGSSDFSSYLLKAQASGAQVIALANGGTDLINTIKQAREFHIPAEGGIVLPFGMFISDVHSLGLETAQGLTFPTGFYWDLNAATRAWSKRFFDRMGRMPTKEHAEAYSSIRHYLLAVAALQSTDAAAVMARMKATPVDDFFAQGGTIREDGRLMHDVYLVQVKTPAESKGAWDYYKVVATIPADEAFQPLAESDCPLVHH